MATTFAAYVARTSKRDVSIAWVLLLSLLFWNIFYQNLPGNLEGFAYHGPVSTANVSDRIGKVFMLAVSLYVLVSRWSLTRSLAKQLNPGLVAVLVCAPLSAVWSIDPTATLLRFTTLAAIVLTCWAIASAGWNRHRFQQLALTPLMLLLVASLIVGMIAPESIAEIGTDISQRNAWHGITHGKNEFGMISSMAVIICANAVLAREGRTFLGLVGAGIAFLCLILSRSNTSLFATILGVTSMVLVMRVPVIRQRYSTHVIVGIAATMLLYELVIQNVIPGTNVLLAPIAALMGKDTTFSARTIIWTVIKQHIALAPWLGTGYGAYWQGPLPTSPSYVFVGIMFFYPMEAHNGYLDIVNDMGLLGLACVLAFLIGFVRQGLELLRIDRSQAALYLGLLFQEMVINMSESDWFSRTNTFAILLLASFCLSRGLLEARRLAQAQPRSLPIRPQVVQHRAY